MIVHLLAVVQSLVVFTIPAFAKSISQTTGKDSPSITEITLSAAQQAGTGTVVLGLVNSQEELHEYQVLAYTPAAIRVPEVLR